MPVIPTMLRFFSHVDSLDVLVVGADIADVGKGEGYDLAGIGGVGQDLLVAGHGGVEAHFAGRMAHRTDAAPLETGAVSEDQEGGRRRFLPAGHGGTPRVCEVG